MACRHTELRPRRPRPPPAGRSTDHPALSGVLPRQAGARIYHSGSDVQPPEAVSYPARVTSNRRQRLLTSPSDFQPPAAVAYRAQTTSNHWQRLPPSGSDFQPAVAAFAAETPSAPSDATPSPTGKPNLSRAARAAPIPPHFVCPPPHFRLVCRPEPPGLRTPSPTARHRFTYYL